MPLLRKWLGGTEKDSMYVNHDECGSYYSARKIMQLLHAREATHLQDGVPQTVLLAPSTSLPEPSRTLLDSVMGWQTPAR